MRVDKQGNYITTNGYNQTSYEPRLVGNRNVFLGEAGSANDEAANMEVRREIAGKRLAAKLAAKAAAEQEQLIRQKDLLEAHQLQMASRHQQEVLRAKDKAFFEGRKFSQKQDTPALVGNHMSGFGTVGEVYLEADSMDSIDINDGSIPTVEDYGQAQSMEPWESEFKTPGETYQTNARGEVYEERSRGEVYQSAAQGERYVSSSAQSSAIKILQGGVYDPSVLSNLPSTIEAMTPVQRQQYNYAMQMENASGAFAPENKQLLMYGAAALAVILLLRR